MKIQRLQEFELYDKMANDFFESFDGSINESDEVNYKKFQDKILKDLRLNTRLSLTFGTGIGAFYTIVEKLMKNMSIDSIELTPDKIVLLTICAFTVVYIEDKKCKDAQEEEILTKDSKSMLEELRMMGIGNGIVKKLIKVFRSFIGIFNLIGKHKGKVIGEFMDMFAYAGILIPIMNGISYIIGKYNLTMDSFIENFFGLSMGIATIITKHGITWLIHRLRNKLNISKEVEKEITDEIETSTIQKLGDFNKIPKSGEMITEQ